MDLRSKTVIKTLKIDKMAVCCKFKKKKNKTAYKQQRNCVKLITNQQCNAHLIEA
jgi:hypothetical protein